MKKRVDIFDLDDTILLTPTFADFAMVDKNNVVKLDLYPGIDEHDKNFIEVLKRIKSFFYIVFSKEVYFLVVGDFIVLYDSKTSSPLSTDYIGYISELTPESMSKYGLKDSYLKDVVRSIGEEDGHVVINNISGFHDNPSTVGRYINSKVYNDYKAAKNRMIVTGRPEKLRAVVDKRLFDLGLPFPNFGLYLFKGGNGSVKKYKVETILQSIKDNNWEEVHFYEDREEWLRAVQDAVELTFPNIDFHAHLIPSMRKL
jgi:hypothetical protein